MTFTYTDKDMQKIRIIQKFEDEIISLTQACEGLGVSERTIYRYLATYRSEWPPWFIHWLKGRPSNHQPLHRKLDWLYQYVTLKKFDGFGPTLLAEKLEEIYWFEVNIETLRRRMIKWGLWVEKPRKQQITRIKRERRSWYGMLIQFDGSYHDWLENGEIWCFLAAVDDATSNLVDGLFMKNESLEDIVFFRESYIKIHWKPWAIYVDCHASYKVNHPQDQFDNEMKTRFQRAMQQLWIVIIFSKCPQGKWRVERWFKTHQDRLIKEMRLAWIKTYNEANVFLNQYYITKHNKKFWKEAKEDWNFHIPITDKEMESFEWLFSKISKRTVKRDGTICYNNTIYQLQKHQVLRKYRTITVKESLIWNIALYSDDLILSFEKIKFR